MISDNVSNEKLIKEINEESFREVNIEEDEEGEEDEEDVMYF